MTSPFTLLFFPGPCPLPSLSIPSLTLFIISLSSSFPNSHVLLLSLISFFLYLPPFPIICVLVFFVSLFFAVLYLYLSLTMPSIRSPPAIIISRKISNNATYRYRSIFFPIQNTHFLSNFSLFLRTEKRGSS